MEGVFKYKMLAILPCCDICPNKETTKRTYKCTSLLVLFFYLKYFVIVNIHIGTHLSTSCDCHRCCCCKYSFLLRYRITRICIVLTIRLKNLKPFRLKPLMWLSVEGSLSLHLVVSLHILDKHFESPDQFCSIFLTNPNIIMIRSNVRFSVIYVPRRLFLASVFRVRGHSQLPHGFFFILIFSKTFVT